MAKILTMGFEDMEKMAKVMGALDMMGIKYNVTDMVKAENEVNESKAETLEVEKPKPAPKKSNDKFDDDLYRACANHFGVLCKKKFTKDGKQCVVNFAKKTMYDAMKVATLKDDGTIKITKKAEKTIKAQLLTEAKRLGEQWMIDLVKQECVGGGITTPLM